MKKFFLTTLLTFATLVGFAQKSTWPITLTTADGLPGEYTVQYYTYNSPVYTFDEATSKLRFTVCSTNTVDTLTCCYDGLSAGWGSGIPFFAISELCIMDANGAKIDYVATSNAVQNNDGGGVAALNDGTVSTYFHSVYSSNTDSYPHEYHYIEMELSKPLKTFSISWNTRSGYSKNVPTYVGITPGTQYTPFPEQGFELSKQVTKVEELAEEGALFVMRSNAPEDYDYNGRLVPRQLFFHAPYGGTETASAANLLRLIPVPEKENTYKVCWLNNGHYMIRYDLNNNYWFNWTDDINSAGSIEFIPCDSVAGDFWLAQYSTVIEDNAYVSYDGLGKMMLGSSNLEGRARPNTLHWTIYKASVNGSGITVELQAEIDEAEARIEAIGGAIPNYDEGEYDALVAALAEAKKLVAKANVTSTEIFKAKENLSKLTTAYAAVSLWAYVDSISTISEKVDDEIIKLCEGPDWVAGAYSQFAFDAMIITADNIQLVIEKCESLADVDNAIEDIHEAIADFWASKIASVKELPFRVGIEEDGLPGTRITGANGQGVWKWESPMWLLTEEVDALRFTVFKTHSGRSFNGKPFVCINEWELYDQNGNKIELTVDNFYSPSVANEGLGLAGLCDGDYQTNNSTHFHSQWSADNDFDGSDYFYLEVSLPEPISGFKLVQYGRGNGYDDVPTDFVFSLTDETYTPDDIDLPNPNNIQLGEKITDVSQITDDGFYALVGLLQCAPGYGGGYEKFYSSNTAYGETLAAPCFFSIRKTGDSDGTFYIQSLADGKYWSSEYTNNGWCNGTVTLEKSRAGKFHIVSNAEARAVAGMDTFPNTFALYMYNESLVRDTVSIPYTVVQDWNTRIGYNSFPSLANNDFDGEGEWYIYKVSMDNPYIYWLKNLYAIASAAAPQAGPDPGFYPEASVSGFMNALAQAQRILEANDNAAAKEAILALDAASDIISNAEANPMVPGVYVIENANSAFFAQQGVKKAMLAYTNNGVYNNVTSEYIPYWANAPADYEKAGDNYKFEFISASENDQVQTWFDNGVITAEDASNAYYIRNLGINQYIGEPNNGPVLSSSINFTDSPEQVYIVRAQGSGKFDIWNPGNANASLHAAGHNNGAGPSGNIVYWQGSTEASQWTLRTVTTQPVEIYTLSISGENGTVSGAGEYPAGTSVQLAAVPDTGYVFSGWYKNGELLSTEPDFSYTVTENVTLVAKFDAVIIGANTMNIATLVTSPGSELVIPVNMDNEQEITAFQLDLYLPEGITIATNEDDELMIELVSGRKTSTHTVVSSRLSDGCYRIASYSSSSKAFKGNSGALLNITTNVSSSLALGDYTLTMKNIRLTSPSVVEYVTPVATSTIRVSVVPGDVNDDGVVTMSDVVATVNYILQQPTSKFNFAGADVTGDGYISMADVVGIVNIVLNPTLTANRYNAKRAAIATNVDRLTISDVRTEAGSASIPVSLDNATDYTAFQMDVELPEGATLAGASLSERAASNHSIAWSTLSDGKVRVVAYSASNAAFSGNVGALLTLDVQSADGAAGTVSVDNVRMVTAAGVENAISGCGSTIDINGTTGISTVDGATIKVYSADGALVVESDKEIQLSIYAANGRLVKVLDVVAGKNIYEALPAGVYVANGAKVIIK